VTVEQAVPLISADARTAGVARWSRLWRLAQQNPLGSVSLAFLAGIALVAVFASLLSPYDPERSITTAALKAPSPLH